MIEVFIKEQINEEQIKANEEYNYKTKINAKKKVNKINYRKRLVPNNVIDFLNNHINIYYKYDYGIYMEIHTILKMIINYIKFYYLYKNEYIICDKPIAELFDLDIGDSILFINLNVRLSKLFQNEYEKIGME
jgi:hypothetical protein